MHTYMYIHVYTYLFIYVYIYIYITYLSPSDHGGAEELVVALDVLRRGALLVLLVQHQPQRLRERVQHLRTPQRH